MLERYKVSAVSDASGNLELFIDKTRDVEVQVVYVTLPANVANYVRDVTIRRADGTRLGIEKAEYTTAGSNCLIFADKFILPAYDPIFIINTATIAVSDLITVEAVYKEVEVL